MGTTFIEPMMSSRMDEPSSDLRGKRRSLNNNRMRRRRRESYRVTRIEVRTRMGAGMRMTLAALAAAAVLAAALLAPSVGAAERNGGEGGIRIAASAARDYGRRRLSEGYVIVNLEELPPGGAWKKKKKKRRGGGGGGGGDARNNNRHGQDEDGDDRRDNIFADGNNAAPPTKSSKKKPSSALRRERVKLRMQKERLQAERERKRLTKQRLKAEREQIRAERIALKLERQKGNPPSPPPEPPNPGPPEIIEYPKETEIYDTVEAEFAVVCGDRKDGRLSVRAKAALERAFLDFFGDKARCDVDTDEVYDAANVIEFVEALSCDGDGQDGGGAAAHSVRRRRRRAARRGTIDGAYDDEGGGDPRSLQDSSFKRERDQETPSASARKRRKRLSYAKIHRRKRCTLCRADDLSDDSSSPRGGRRRRMQQQHQGKTLRLKALRNPRDGLLRFVAEEEWNEESLREAAALQFDADATMVDEPPLSMTSLLEGVNNNEPLPLPPPLASSNGLPLSPPSVNKEEEMNDDESSARRLSLAPKEADAAAEEEEETRQFFPPREEARWLQQQQCGNNAPNSNAARRPNLVKSLREENFVSASRANVTAVINRDCSAVFSPDCQNPDGRCCGSPGCRCKSRGVSESLCLAEGCILEGSSDACCAAANGGNNFFFYPGCASHCDCRDEPYLEINESGETTFERTVAVGVGGYCPLDLDGGGGRLSREETKELERILLRHAARKMDEGGCGDLGVVYTEAEVLEFVAEARCDDPTLPWTGPGSLVTLVVRGECSRGKKGLCASGKFP